MVAKSHAGQFLLVVETPENFSVNKIRENVERGFGSRNISVVSVERLDYSLLQVKEAQNNMKKSSVKKLFDAISKAPKELQSELRKAVKELIDIEDGLDDMVASSLKRDELLDQLEKGTGEVREKLSGTLKKAREEYKDLDNRKNP